MARVTSELTITPIHPVLGARVEGVCLAGPMDEPTFRRLFEAFQEHAVLVFHESRRLLDELLAHTIRPEAVFQHRWRPWDLVMWDNRCVLHRGRPWDAARHRRVMRRTTVAGEGPTADPPLATRLPIWDGVVPAAS